ASPSHTYTAPGTYTVTLTETGPGGTNTRTRTDYIVVVEPPPAAEFTGTPTSGTAPLVVAFTNQSTGAITSHAWTFGDGASSSLASPSHTYTAPGTYTVTLTETGPGGTDTRTRTDYIVVVEPPPIAAFTSDRHRGKGWLPVRFTDVSQGAITQWSWNFGDGASSSVANPFHLYRQPGVYTVTLTVSGPGGADSETKTGYVIVNGAASAGAPTRSVTVRVP
ncbi:MAG: PKD domain-containing protein, partial [Planctomycetota bacterium]